MLTYSTMLFNRDMCNEGNPDVFFKQIWSSSSNQVYKGKLFNLLSTGTQHWWCFIMYLACLWCLFILHSCISFSNDHSKFLISFIYQVTLSAFSLWDGCLTYQASAASRTDTVISLPAKEFEGWIQIFVKLHGGMKFIQLWSKHNQNWSL